MITVTCDKCDRPFQVSDEQAGRKVPCPACGDIKVIPGAAGAPATAGGDRAVGMGLPPATGPEVTVLRARGAAFRTRPLASAGIAIVGVAALVGTIGFAVTAALPLAIVCGAAVVGAAATLAYWQLQSWSARLEVTNKRVVFTKGILSKTTVEMLHRTIQDIEIKQSLLDRLLNVGTISIANASEDDDAILLGDVPNPYKVRETIDAYRPM